MKRIFWVVSMVLISFLWVSPSFSGGDIRDAEKPQGLEVYNNRAEPLGVVKKREGKLIFFDKDAVSFKQHNKDEWGIYDVSNSLVGKLTKNNEHLALKNRNDEFSGFIFYVKDRGRLGDFEESSRLEPVDLKDQFEFISTVVNSQKINPKDAKLYYNVMESLK